MDSLTLTHADLKSLGNVEQTDFVPFDPVMKRTEGSIRDLVTGDQYKTTKGAPHVIMQLTDDESVKRQCEIDVTSLGMRGIRCLAVAKTDKSGAWVLLGLLTFLDPPRHDTKVIERTASTAFCRDQIGLDWRRRSQLLSK